MTNFDEKTFLELDQLPPLDARSLRVDVNYEVRRTLVDLIRGSSPTTILGVIVANPSGVAVREVAERIQQPFGLVDWSIDKLEEDDLCVRIAEDGIDKILPFAAYTERNGADK